MGKLYPRHEKRTKNPAETTGNRYKIEILMSRTQKLKGLVAASLILKTLNDNPYLISGNHDIKNLRQNYTKYFEHISMQMYIEVDKQKIYLNHCPFLCYGGSYNGTWQLFGHVHTSRNNTGKDAPRLSMLLPTQYDVGVDNNDFTPVSFAQVKAIIEKQIEQSKKGEQ